MHFNYLCPVCGKNLVMGVMHRVEALSDRPQGFVPEGAVPALHLVPLEEILGEVYNIGAQAGRIRKEYHRLIERGGSEFRILLDLDEEELRSFMDDRLVDGIMQVRQGKGQVKPGYDGVYGHVKIFEKEPPPLKTSSQLNLF